MAVTDTGSRRASLQACSLFAGLDAEALNVLAEAMIPEDFAPGETVCQQGEVADRVFLVHRGVLAVMLPGSDQPVRRLGPHELVGEYGMFGGVRTSTLVAEGPTTLLSVDYQRFDALCRRYPAVLHGLLREAVRRLREAEARLAARP